LQLETGTNDAIVNYTSGSGTDTLVFAYTVGATHTSAHLDFLAADSLALSTGTIKDSFGNDATLTLAAPAATNSLFNKTSLVVDGAVPTVSSVTVTEANGLYKTGDVLHVVVNFSEAVTVTGTPQITVETGTTDRAVNYVSGSGSSALTFTYTIQAGDNSADLDYASTTALALNSGTIKDAVGNPALLTLVTPGQPNSISNAQAIVVDTLAPTVLSVSSSTPDASYKADAVINVMVTFNESVVVTTTGGTPKLQLETNSAFGAASYVSGSPGTILTFNYTVVSGDQTSDLDYRAISSLVTNGGTFKDAAGNDAVLTLAAPMAAGSLGNAKAILIDTTAPLVLSVTSNTANASYGVGQSIDVRVVMSETVAVTGTPTITVETGTTDRVVSYSSLATTTLANDTMVFNYTTQTGDLTADLDYVSNASLVLAGGTITDAAVNSASLSLPAPSMAGSLGANKAIVVDAVPPTVSYVTASPTTGSYKLSQAITLQVVFSKAVYVTLAVPTLQLETGASDALVNYSSGSGTNTLVFTYTVGSGDASSHLDYTTINALAIGAAAIKDSHPAHIRPAQSATHHGLQLRLIG
jgi:hypothetical protein